nr:uncharacterized protein LOC128695952 [Cherax quadricarinatus]
MWTRLWITVTVLMKTSTAGFLTEPTTGDALPSIYEYAEAVCPCVRQHQCPAYYGSSPLDILNYGNLPPCLTYGRFRCCKNSAITDVLIQPQVDHGTLAGGTFGDIINQGSDFSSGSSTAVVDGISFGSDSSLGSSIDSDNSTIIGSGVNSGSNISSGSEISLEQNNISESEISEGVSIVSGSKDIISSERNNTTECEKTESSISSSSDVSSQHVPTMEDGYSPPPGHSSPIIFCFFLLPGFTVGSSLSQHHLRSIQKIPSDELNSSGIDQLSTSQHDTFPKLQNNSQSSGSQESEQELHQMENTTQQNIVLSYGEYQGSNHEVVTISSLHSVSIHPDDLNKIHQSVNVYAEINATLPLSQSLDHPRNLKQNLPISVKELGLPTVPTTPPTSQPHWQPLFRSYHVTRNPLYYSAFYNQRQNPSTSNSNQPHPRLWHTTTHPRYSLSTSLNNQPHSRLWYAATHPRYSPSNSPSNQPHSRLWYSTRHPRQSLNSSPSDQPHSELWNTRKHPRKRSVTTTHRISPRQHQLEFPTSL